MKTIVIDESLNATAAQVWTIVSDITRADWVPSVESITAIDDVRSFTMAGIGEVQEKILLLDHEALCLQYSAIKTPSMVAHHLAKIQLEPSDHGCRIIWTTEIEPDEFAVAVEHGMRISLQGLRGVLANSLDKPSP